MSNPEDKVQIRKLYDPDELTNLAGEIMENQLGRDKEPPRKLIHVEYTRDDDDFSGFVVSADVDTEQEAQELIEFCRTIRWVKIEGGKEQ
jgi:hypothetical protein